MESIAQKRQNEYMCLRKRPYWYGLNRFPTQYGGTPPHMRAPGVPGRWEVWLGTLSIDFRRRIDRTRPVTASNGFVTAVGRYAVGGNLGAK